MTARRTLLILGLAAHLAVPHLALASGRERPWGDGQRLQPLPFTQIRRQPLLRSHLKLLIPAAHRPEALKSLWIEWPPRFDGSVLPNHVLLCRMVTPPQVSTTRCVEVLPARVEWAGARQLHVIPAQPLAGAATLGLSLRLYNPSLAGLYPLRLRAGVASRPDPVYVGTWLLGIESEGE